MLLEPPAPHGSELKLVRLEPGTPFLHYTNPMPRAGVRAVSDRTRTSCFQPILSADSSKDNEEEKEESNENDPGIDNDNYSHKASKRDSDNDDDDGNGNYNDADHDNDAPHGIDHEGMVVVLRLRTIAPMVVMTLLAMVMVIVSITAIGNG